MIKIEITIPQFYNDKTPIEQVKFDKIKRELLREFKGLTISEIAKGYWLDDENKEYADINKIYTVVTDIYNEDTELWLTGYKKWLEYMLEQKEIFITKSDIDVL